MENTDQKIKAEFQIYLQRITQKYLLVIFGMAIVVISGFAISDILFRKNIYAAYTRLIPLSFGLPLWLFQIVTKENYTSLKFKLYNFSTALVLVMMYAKYLVYIHDEGAGYSVSGIVVVIFLISMDLKTNIVNSILTYFVPTIIFTIILFLIPDINPDKIVNLSNVYPMVILGFVLNRVQYNLRFKLFRSNYLLNREKQITKELYEESKDINNNLKQKNKEIEVQKQAIIEKNQLLEKIVTDKDTLFSVISHDLKSAFNAMVGFSSNLHEEFKDLDEGEKEMHVNYIYKSINAAYKLLENLLLWAQSQRHDQNATIENHNIFLIAKEAINAIKQQASAKNIRIVNNVDPETKASVDKNYLETIFRNLLSNAVKFSHENSLVNITHELKNTNNGNTKHILCVEDNGVGIPENKLNVLFDLSQNSSTSGTNYEKGTGLGLILCKELTEKMGGKLLVESKVGEGSRFIISLPS